MGKNCLRDPNSFVLSGLTGLTGMFADCLRRFVWGTGLFVCCGVRHNGCPRRADTPGTETWAPKAGERGRTDVSYLKCSQPSDVEVLAIWLRCERASAATWELG